MVVCGTALLVAPPTLGSRRRGRRQITVSCHPFPSPEPFVAAGLVVAGARPHFLGQADWTPRQDQLRRELSHGYAWGVPYFPCVASVSRSSPFARSSGLVSASAQMVFGFEQLSQRLLRPRLAPMGGIRQRRGRADPAVFSRL